MKTYCGKKQNRRARRILFLFILSGLLTACGGKPVEQSRPLSSLSHVSPAEWNALANRRVFFGHQSVGANIVAGITDILSSHPEIPIRVVESKDLPGSVIAGFYHAKIGRNEPPEA